MEKKKSGFLDKLDNFWYYHKGKVFLALLVAVVIIACIGYVNSVTDKTEYDFCVTSVFARPMTTGDYTINEQLEDVISDIDKNGSVAINAKSYYITEAATGDNDSISIAKFEADISRAAGDLLLFDRANLERFLPKDLFADISEYVDISQFPEENIVYREDVPVAVRLKDSKVLTDMKFIIDDIYACVMFTPDNADDATLASRNTCKAAIEKLIQK